MADGAADSRRLLHLPVDWRLPPAERGLAVARQAAAILSREPAQAAAIQQLVVRQFDAWAARQAGSHPPEFPLSVHWMSSRELRWLPGSPPTEAPYRLAAVQRAGGELFVLVDRRGRAAVAPLAGGAARCTSGVALCAPGAARDAGLSPCGRWAYLLLAPHAGAPAEAELADLLTPPPFARWRAPLPDGADPHAAARGLARRAPGAPPA